jgi:hypothetical protein
MDTINDHVHANWHTRLNHETACVLSKTLHIDKYVCKGGYNL